MIVSTGSLMAFKIWKKKKILMGSFTAIVF